MTLDLFSSMAYFVDIIESGSFTSAARKNYISVSVVSRHLRALEEYLGEILIIRTTREHQVTPAGYIYFNEAKQIISNVNYAKTMVKDVSGYEICGNIRVSLPGFFQLRYAAELKLFLNKYPKINLIINNNLSPIQLLDKTSDLVISEFFVSSKQMNCKYLCSIKKNVYASPKYLEQYGIPKNIYELKNHNCLIYTMSSPHDEWCFNNDVKIKVKGNYSVSSGVSIIPAAVAGIGLTWVSDLLVEQEVADGTLLKVDIDPGSCEVDLRMYYLPISYTGVLKIFIEWFLENVQVMINQDNNLFIKY